MKYVLAALTCGLLVVGSGCALFGVHTGADGKPVSDGSGGPLGTLVGLFAPWATTAIVGLAGAYADAKRRNWKAAAVSTVKTIEDFKATPQGSKVWDGLKKKLVKAHTPKSAKLIDAITKK